MREGRLEVRKSRVPKKVLMEKNISFTLIIYIFIFYIYTYTFFSHPPTIEKAQGRVISILRARHLAKIIKYLRIEGIKKTSEQLVVYTYICRFLHETKMNFMA